MGMAGTHAEVESQHVESGIGFKIKQQEKQFSLRRGKLGFRPARRKPLDFSLPKPFLVEVATRFAEGDRQVVEFRPSQADQGLDGAVAFLAVEADEFFVEHSFKPDSKENIYHIVS